MGWAPKIRADAAKAAVCAILVFAFLVCALTPQAIAIEPIGSTKPVLAAHTIGLTASLSGTELKRTLTERPGLLLKFVSGFASHAITDRSLSAVNYPPAEPQIGPRSFPRSTDAGRSPPA